MLFNNEQVYDVAIIGGGINGCGCAADAALRGLSVVLCEQDDLASKTSSNSSKLIHGGLRYLEHFDFSLVKAALDEQQTLLGLAPHLIRPLSFVLPYEKKGRPLWMLRAGLFLYDHLSRKNQLPNSKLISRQHDSLYFTPLATPFNKGFLFYDCATDDARLTVVNALQAKEHGATILPHTKLTHSEVIAGQWCLTLQPKSGSSIHIKAKSLINATGPWVVDTNQLLQIPAAHTISLVKGSHVVVPKLYEGEHAYLLQNLDKRIVFAVPYHGNTMIGTTEVMLSADHLENVQIERNEITYLLTLINQYFKKTLHAKDIVHSWSGVRPLLSAPGKTATALSRDYAYHFSTTPAPAVTIYGGKITTYRQLALKAVNPLKTVFPDLAESRSNRVPLPGGALDNMDFLQYCRYVDERYHWLDTPIRERYLNSYGTRTEKILAGCQCMADLGRTFSHTLYQVEVDYLLDEEWAHDCDDILWRRTKLGLSIDATGKARLTDYISERRP